MPGPIALPPGVSPAQFERGCFVRFLAAATNARLAMVLGAPHHRTVSLLLALAQLQAPKACDSVGVCNRHASCNVELRFSWLLPGAHVFLY